MNPKSPHDKKELSKNKGSSDNRRFLMRYASLGTQLLVAVGLAVFIGIKLDQWLHVSPLFSAVLPLLVLVGIFYKLMKETAKPPKDDQ